MDSFVFEAYGPEKVAIIIEGITDNKNRTISEIKQILNQNNGKLAEEGSVKWLFEKKGSIVIDSKEQEEQFQKKEQLDLEVIEAGAEDIVWRKNNILEIYTKPENLEPTKNNLKESRIKIDSSSISWISKEELEVNEKTTQKCQNIFEELDENDAVQEIYSNLKT